MNNKQKRARRMRARAHQKDVRGKVAVKTYRKAGGDEEVAIEVPRGPQPSPGLHASDEPKHGRREDARARLERLLREVGIEEPTGSNCREFSRLIRTCGGDVQLAQRRLKEDLAKVYKERAADIAQLNADATDHGFTAIDKVTGQRVDPADIKSERSIQGSDGEPINVRLLNPTEEQWEKLVADAKRRKRGIQRFVEQAGFALLENNDPKQRESWVRS